MLGSMRLGGTGAQLGATSASVRRIVLSPVDDRTDAGAVDQTILTESATELTFSVVEGALSGTVYVFVQNPAGAWNSSGYPVTLSAGIIASTGMGGVQATGLAPSARLDTRAQTGLGAVAVTGFAPAIAVTVLTGLGSLRVTGFQPSLGGAATASTGLGTVSVSGFAPAVAVGRTIATGLGSLRVSSSAPTLAVSVRTGLGSVTCTGFAPSAVNSGLLVLSVPVAGVGDFDTVGVPGLDDRLFSVDGVDPDDAVLGVF